MVGQQLALLRRRPVFSDEVDAERLGRRRPVQRAGEEQRHHDFADERGTPLGDRPPLPVDLAEQEPLADEQCRVGDVAVQARVAEVDPARDRTLLARSSSSPSLELSP
jgi:hypothetical protein